MRLLEGTAGGPRYDGPRHFDAHAYRTEDDEGVWEFARGCMRSYLILRDKAKAFDADPEVKAMLSGASAPDVACLRDGYSSDAATRLRSLEIDVDEIARTGLGYERLDQILHEHLLGVRG